MRARQNVTAKEAATLVGCTPKTVWQNLRRGRIIGAREIGVGVRVAVEHGRFGYRLVPRRSR